MFRFFAFGEETGSIEDRTCSPAAPPILLESSPIVNWHYTIDRWKSDIDSETLKLIYPYIPFPFSLSSSLFKISLKYSNPRVPIRSWDPKEEKGKKQEESPSFFLQKIQLVARFLETMLDRAIRDREMGGEERSVARSAKTA